MKAKKLIANVGIYFCAVVGAGYASGQEVMQFFTNFGLLSIPIIVVVGLLFAFLGSFFIDLAYELKTNNLRQMLHALCGKYVGTAVDWIITFITFGCIGMMFSGAGTTMADYFGVDSILARIIAAVICLLVVLISFQAIAGVSGVIGPVLIVSLLGVSILAALHPTGTLEEAASIIETADVYRSAPSIFISFLLYVSYCVVPHIPTLGGIGTGEPDKKMRMLSGWMGGIALGVCLFGMNYVLLLNYGSVYESSIPLVECALAIDRNLGLYFGVLLIAATLTTAISLLYSTVTRFTEYGTPRSKIFTVIVAAVSILLGFIPFAELVNFLYPLLGYAGSVVIACGLWYKFRPKKAAAGKD